ncbi:uncharacterized protein LOC128873544 [Hylaeus volcanicus]|uniref:uncharacterized protein LOC128873544 n=1 Tax=Hylaeus volcanicus TaxID=313075 RepID=UPI0023B835C2|nr:uncharacterized protein LOC128873544 [Hylaeus volcanicus]
MRKKSFEEATAMVTAANFIVALRNPVHSTNKKKFLFTWMYDVLILFGITSSMLYFDFWVLQKMPKNLERESYKFMIFIFAVGHVYTIVLGLNYSQDILALRERMAKMDDSLGKLGSTANYNALFYHCLIIGIMYAVYTYITCRIYLKWLLQEKMSRGPLIFFAGVDYVITEHISTILIYDFVTYVYWLEMKFKQTNDLMKTFFVGGCQRKTKGLNEYTFEPERNSRHQSSRRLTTYTSEFYFRRTRIFPISADSNTNDKQQTAKKLHLLQKIRFLHLQLCNIAKTVNRVFDKQLMMQTTVVLTIITLLLYFNYNQFSVSAGLLANLQLLLLQGLEFLCHSAKIVFASYSCEQAAKQVSTSDYFSALCKQAILYWFQANKIKEIIHAFSELEFDPEMKDEILQFSLQTSLSQIGKSKSSFFRLNYVFLRTCMSVVTTYVIIMVQLGPAFDSEEPDIIGNKTLHPRSSPYLQQEESRQLTMTKSFEDATAIINTLSMFLGMRYFEDPANKTRFLFTWIYDILILIFNVMYTLHFAARHTGILSNSEAQLSYIIVVLVSVWCYVCTLILGWHHSKVNAEIFIGIPPRNGKLLSLIFSRLHRLLSFLFQNVLAVREKIAKVDESLRNLGSTTDYRHLFQCVITALSFALLCASLYLVLLFKWLLLQKIELFNYFISVCIVYQVNVSAIIIYDFVTYVYWLEMKYKQTNELVKAFFVDGHEIKTDVLKEYAIKPTRNHRRQALNNVKVYMSEYCFRRTRVFPLIEDPSLEHESQTARKVRMLGTIRCLHRELSLIVKMVNKIFNTQLALQTTMTMVFYTITLYNIYISIISSPTDVPKTAVKAVVNFIEFFNKSGIIALACYSCEYTMKEANKMRDIIYALSVEGSDTELKDEILQFSLQLSLTHFGRSNFFQLNYTALRTSGSFVITYLFILMQYRPVFELSESALAQNETNPDFTVSFNVTYLVVVLSSWYHSKEILVVMERIATVDKNLKKLGSSLHYNDLFYRVLIVWTISFFQSTVLCILYWKWTMSNNVVPTGVFSILTYAYSGCWLELRFKNTNALLKSLLVDGNNINTGRLKKIAIKPPSNRHRRFPSNFDIYMAEFCYRRTQAFPPVRVPNLEHVSQASRVDFFRQIRLVHLQLCSIAKMVNKLFDMQLMMIFTVILIYLTMVLYFAYNEIDMRSFNFAKTFKRVFVHFVEVVGNIWKISLTCYRCECTGSEANKIKEIIHMFSMQEFDEEMKDEILQFSMQVSLSQIGKSKSTFFRLNNVFLRSCVSFVVTYTIIIMQMSPSFNSRDSILFGNETDYDPDSTFL